MFTRIVTMNVKPGQGAKYAVVIEEQVIPLMRTFSGFRDEIAMLSPDGKQAVGISFWDGPEYAEAYNRDGFPRVLAALEAVVEGRPAVVSYDVTNSTSHHIVARTTGA